MPSPGNIAHDAPPSLKRQRRSSSAEDADLKVRLSPVEKTEDAAIDEGVGIAAKKTRQGSSFRNVSACNRCRLRKNRCDQRLPSCASCAKAGVACIGYDPITKEIPRSYVFYLETRVEQLENILRSNSIPYPAAENLEICSRHGFDAASVFSSAESGSSYQAEVGDRYPLTSNTRGVEPTDVAKAGQRSSFLNLVSSARPRSLAAASGVSFARVVFAAVQYSVSGQHGSRETCGAHKPSGSGISMRESFFGLYSKPKIRPAPFPDRTVGQRLVTLYFEHANPQIPILHRGEFMQVFERAYENAGQNMTARELYSLNMVFAIGCGVIVGEPVKTGASGDIKMRNNAPGSNQGQPEEYHASAIVHLESCLSFSGGGLEVLQAVLLLANFALLRPVPPGLWYIVGVAVRLAVDLGLHREDGVDTSDVGVRCADSAAHDHGRRLWIREKRWRLWWCSYAFDRLVSTCVGRPFGISDQVITKLPSLLDDDYITPHGFKTPPSHGQGEMLPRYKHVAHHYIRLRMLQSEILQVLQYNQAQLVRASSGQAKQYPEMHTHLPSPFLIHFDSFRSWRIDIKGRLYQWKASAPTRVQTGVAFSTEFLELNYWQAIIMLYRQSLSVPTMLAGEYNVYDEVSSTATHTAELREDEDRIFLTVAEAGQKILRLYRQLHLRGLVSYTYLSTHHLFMAGISYLYAIWNSPLVRSHLSMDEVDFTVLAAKSVFTDMIDKYPPAETCRDAFDRTAKATVKMAGASGGFGAAARQTQRHRREVMSWNGDAAPGMNERLSGHTQSSSSVQSAMSFCLACSNTTPHLHGGLGGHVKMCMDESEASETDALMSTSHPPSAHGGMDEKTQVDESTSIDPCLVSSTSPLPHRDPGVLPIDPRHPVLSHHFGLHGAMEFPDAQTSDFLRSLAGKPDGDANSLDPAPLDLGFGMNWGGRARGRVRGRAADQPL